MSCDCCTEPVMVGEFFGYVFKAGVGDATFGEVEGDNDAAMIARGEAEAIYDGDFTRSNFFLGDVRSYKTYVEETFYEVRRVKFKIEHGPVATCYLKVWLQARWLPSGGTIPDDYVYTDFVEYEWNGSGDPCFDMPVASIFSSEYEQEPPDSNGSISILVKKFSYLASYDPPDDGSANGFPPGPNQLGD